MRLAPIVVLLCIFSVNLFAQEQPYSSFAFSIKPILAKTNFRSAKIQYETDNIKAEITPSQGIIWGMVIRRKLSSSFSIESGIYQNNRKVNIKAETTDSQNDSWEYDLAIQNFEIPANLLVFVPFNNNFYLNASAGGTFNFYPSHLSSFDNEAKDPNARFSQTTYRKNWLNMALNANTGIEYRTREWGALYLGVSYHRPFSSPLVVTVERSNSSSSGAKPFEEYATELNANYLTLDIRYFFPESRNDGQKTVQGRGYKSKRWKKRKKKESDK